MARPKTTLRDWGTPWCTCQWPDCPGEAAATFCPNHATKVSELRDQVARLTDERDAALIDAGHYLGERDHALAANKSLHHRVEWLISRLLRYEAPGVTMAAAKSDGVIDYDERASIEALFGWSRK